MLDIALTRSRAMTASRRTTPAMPPLREMTATIPPTSSEKTTTER